MESEKTPIQLRGYIQGSTTVTGRLTVKRRLREYARRHPIWFTLNILLTFVPALFTGTWWGLLGGLALSGLCLWVGSRASVRIIEYEVDDR